MYNSNITVDLDGWSIYTPTVTGPKKLHCDTVISPEPTVITAVITIGYWLLCFGDSNQNRNLQPSAHRDRQNNMIA